MTVDERNKKQNQVIREKMAKANAHLIQALNVSATNVGKNWIESQSFDNRAVKDDFSDTATTVSNLVNRNREHDNFKNWLNFKR